MPIIEKDKKVIIHWIPKTKKYFEEKGYVFTKMFAPFEVSIFDTVGTNTTKVKCICDECGKEFQSGYSSVKEDCRCQRCKTTESYMKRYGVPHNMKSKEGKEAHQKAILKKYGVKNVFQNDEIKQKIKQTCLEKYGVEHPLQNKEILEKEKQTNLERYGVEFVMQNKEKFAMSQATCKKHYGVITPMQNKTIRDKANSTLIKNGASKNQIRLNEWLCGTLNYPVLIYRLDVALVQDKIDVEYDGGGHDMAVYRKGMPIDEFQQKEQQRNNKIMSEGWKVVRINSKRDKLPDKQLLLDFIEVVKNTFVTPIVIEWEISTNLVKFNEKEYDIFDFIKKVGGYNG